MKLPSWLDKMLGRSQAPAPSEPTSFPSQATLDEREQAERDKAEEPPDPPAPDITP